MKRLLILDFAGLGDAVIKHPILQALEAANPSVHYFHCDSVLNKSQRVSSHAPLYNSLGSVPARWAKYLPSDRAAIQSFVEQQEIDALINLQADFEYISAFQHFREMVQLSCPIISLDYKELIESAPILVRESFRETLSKHFLLGEVPAHWLESARIHAPEAPIVFYTGSYEPCKRWPAEDWVKLALSLDKAQSRPIEILGGIFESEQRLLGEIADSTTGTDIKVHQSSTFNDMEQVLARAHKIVSNDSGPAHLAAAMGVPSLTLFWNSNAHRWRPLSQGSIALNQDLAPTAEQVTQAFFDEFLDGISSAGVISPAKMARVPTIMIGAPEAPALSYVESHRGRLTRDPISRKAFQYFIEQTGYSTICERRGFSYQFSRGEWVKVSESTWRTGPMEEPVQHVTWWDARAFARYLGQARNREGHLPFKADLLDMGASLRSQWCRDDFFGADDDNSAMALISKGFYGGHIKDFSHSELHFRVFLS